MVREGSSWTVSATRQRRCQMVRVRPLMVFDTRQRKCRSVRVGSTASSSEMTRRCGSHVGVALSRRDERSESCEARVRLFCFIRSRLSCAIIAFAKFNRLISKVMAENVPQLVQFCFKRSFLLSAACNECLLTCGGKLIQFCLCISFCCRSALLRQIGWSRPSPRLAASAEVLSYEVYVIRKSVGCRVRPC
eukprot:2964451-Prymnesium_polylepis.2